MSNKLECIDCKRLKPTPTVRGGRCNGCYSKFRYDNDPDFRARKLKAGSKWDKKMRATSPEYREKQKEYGNKAIRKPKARFNMCVSLSRRRGLEFTLTFEQYAELITKSCHYCEGPLPQTAYGLDRVNNTRGYTIENVVPCCKECNRLKGDQYTSEETKVMINALKEYRNDIAA